MADAYSYPLLVELEENQVPKLKNKLVKYFQSKKSSGGDCEVVYTQGERTAVLRFRREEDQRNVFQKQTHQIVLDQIVLKMTVRLTTQEPPVQETPTKKKKSDAAVANQQPTTDEVEPAAEGQAEAAGDHDDVEDDASCCMSAVIGNIPKDVHLEFLEMLVENIIRTLDSPLNPQNFILQHIPDISSAVVTFQSENENTNFQTRCHQNKTFRNRGFSVRPLEATEQVVVEDIQNLNQDMLHLYFESLGLDVETIVVDEDGESAVITFKDHKGVNRIAGKKHNIKQKEIRVYPFYESLGVVIYGKDKPSLKLPADISETIDSAVWKYLTDNPSAAETIHSDLGKHFCHVNLSQSAVCLSPVPSLLQFKDAKAVIKKWTHTVKSAFAHAMCQFKSLQFNPGSQIFEECEMKIAQMNENVVVVPDRAKGVLSVAGLVKDVDGLQKPLSDLIAKIEKRVQRERSSETQAIKMSPSTFHILSQDGFQERLLKLFPELLMCYEKENATLNITGISNEIIVGYKSIIDIMMSMKRQHLELEDFLLDLLKGEQEEKLTEALLTSNGLNVAFEIGAHRVQLLGVSEKDLKDAHDHVAQVLKCHYIDIEDPKVVKKSEWQPLVSQLEKDNSKPCRTEIRTTGTQVVVSGHKDSVTNVSRKLNDFILHNTQVEEPIVVKPQVILEYIKSLDSSWLMQFKDKVVVSYRPEAICLTGSRADVTECKDLFDEIITSVSFDTLKISKPGMKKFFQENKDVYIPLAKSQTGCLVHLVDDTRGSQGSTSLFPQPACHLQTADGVDIVICKADMCSYPVHAVVNSSNQDLKHSGGLAEALLKAAGPQLQAECDRIIKSKGQLKPGDCEITAAGGPLPCKKIIHTVAPRFEPKKANKSVAQLKRAVKGSLELAEANSCNSVALPVISSTLGFPLHLCAVTIVKAVKEHCDEKCDDGTLKTIHFVDNDDTAVQAMEAAVRQEFGNQSVDSTQKKSSKRPIGKNAAPYPCLCYAQTKEGLDIILKKGLIEAATTEVIVNVVFEDLALNKGAVSNAILLEAGSKLQQKILAKAPSGKFGDVIVTDGCKLKSSHVFHAVTPQWDNGKGAAEKTLKGIFKDCLNTAETFGLTSISFPAVGTGNLGFPKDQVLSWMLDEVDAFSSNNPKHLKKVVIVLFPGDIKTIQVFSDEFVKKFPNASSTSVSAGSSKSSGGVFSKVVSQSRLHETTMGSVTIQIVEGDITKETSDLIVNSSNETFTLKSGVSKAIMDAAGPAVETECKNLGALPNPGIIITQPGNLKCNKILHLVGNTDPAVIKCRMKEALKMCMSKSYSSVSFPAIGTGQGGVRAKAVADAMLDAVIDELSKSTSSPLMTIRIVIFQPPMVNDFLSSMQERVAGDHDPKNKGFWESISLKLKALFTNDNTSTPQQDEDFIIEPLEVDPACFHICGDTQTRIDLAKQWITDLVTKEQYIIVITDDIILSFSHAEHQFIHDIQVRLGVSIKTVGKNGQASITIEGVSRDVVQANNEIYKILNTLKQKEELERKMSLASTVADWQYKHGHGFKRFDKMSNFKLEEAFEKKLVSVKIRFNGKDYTVTMPSGPANDNQGGTMEIKRIDKLKDEELPDCWDAMPPNTSSHSVAVLAGSAEYDEVLKLFQATCPQTVIKIERIQNPVLWKSLQVKKRHMEERKSLQNNERRLFHGTCEDIVPTINKYGFNRSYAGKNAAYYGNGTYFAVNAKYSAQDTYSRPNQAGEKCMYLCRVLTGEFTLGKRDMITPPPKSPGSIEMFDSVVDAVQNPSMFVIFHDTQAYPEYLITFK